MNFIELNYPLVTIITVNYNQSRVTIDLLISLSKISYPNFEIIVIDNGSRDQSLKNEIKNFPTAHYFYTDSNLGFAGGNNFGLKYAKGKYILFLNNDTEVAPDFLEPLVNRFESNSELGLLSPKIRFFDHPDRIQYAGYTDLNFFTLRNNILGYNEIDNGQYDHAAETFFAHGAAMMTSMNVIKKVGMMSEIFFLYYEEMDWGSRIRKAGFKIFYEPKSIVYHKESVTTGKNSPLKTYYYARNRLIYLRRNFSGYRFILGLLYHLFIAIPKNLMFFVIKGEFKLLRSFLSGILWHVNNFRNSEIYSNPNLII